MVNLSDSLTQSEFGALVGISQQAVSDLVQRKILVNGHPGNIWLIDYCAHIREQAAGRAAAGDLDLASERAALAKVQRERIEMQNAITRRELAPVSILELALATVGRKVAAVLESIPIEIKRRTKNLSREDFDILVAEITKARNIAATANFEADETDGSILDSESDPAWAQES
ncbi:terminase small subunit [Undibacterium sp. SXout20W]|uniref:terminase small subunit n=1 Tax=Undibacterium sp. SXout20W TaxID=3413051 RepID=UPI003BEF8E2C